MNLNGPSPLIWVIDDDDIHNYVVGHLLNMTNVQCKSEVFTDAIVATEKIKKLPVTDLPDIILLDINMPVMNAWDFLDIIKTIAPDPLPSTRTYVLSSSIYEKDIDKAREYPAVYGYLTKPVSLTTINDVIGGTLSPTFVHDS